jgi:hypothetical protein
MLQSSRWVQGDISANTEKAAVAGHWMLRALRSSRSSWTCHCHLTCACTSTKPSWLVIIARRPPRHAEILDMISMVSMSSLTSVPRGNSSVLYSIDLSSVAKAKSNTAMQLSTMKSAKEAWLMQGATPPATAKDPSRRPHQHHRQTE